MSHTPKNKWRVDQVAAIDATWALVIERKCIPNALLVCALVVPADTAADRKLLERSALTTAMVRLPLGVVSADATFARYPEGDLGDDAQCYRADAVLLHVITGGLVPAVALHHRSTP